MLHNALFNFAICSTCFGHVYADHQELATILLVWHVASNSWLLAVGGSGAGRARNMLSRLQVQ